MRGGRLKKRLELYSKAATRDSYGASLTTITLQDTVWGALEPLRGVEYFAQQTLHGEIDTRIILRYDSSLALDESWVIKHPTTGVFYDIQSIDANLRKRQWTLMCRSGESEDQYSVTADTSFLLMENGSYLLLENGDNMILEG